MSDSDRKVEVQQGPAEPTGGPTRAPHVDIYETDDGLTVVAELPGVSQEDVAVQVEKGVLTIGGQARPAAPLSGYRAIYEGIADAGNFFRAFALSDEIDREKATATFANGVLTVRLPRAADSQTRKIPVQAGP